MEMTRSYKAHQKKHSKYYEEIQDKWREFEKQYWKQFPGEKYCHVCGETRRIELHHICPRHVCPDRIFDENNLIPLCRCCHFRFGHLGDWDNWNPHIVEDAKKIYSLLKRRK